MLNLIKFLLLRRAQTGQHVGQHFDQHRLTNMLASMLVRFALCTNMLEKEKIKEKCWPTFLKKLRNVGQQICKNRLKWHVCAVCGAYQHVGQHGISIRMCSRIRPSKSNVHLAFRMFFL